MDSHLISHIPAREALEMIQRLEGSFLVKEDIPPDPPRNPCANLVGGMTSSWHAKNVVQLFQCSLSVVCLECGGVSREGT